MSKLNWLPNHFVLNWSWGTIIKCKTGATITWFNQLEENLPIQFLTDFIKVLEVGA